jgi:hypothetical protein
MEWNAATPWFGSKKGPAAVATFFLSVIVTILSASWPQIYGFAQDTQSTSARLHALAPVRLSDEVMISLRSGYILKETGRPAFNRGDTAQPSTSYLSPYLFALLSDVFPGNLSVALYALLGLLAVALTLGAIVLSARSTGNAVFLVAALLVTTTNLEYALNGWDHLFQGLFLTLATCMALAKNAGPARMLAVSVLLTLGFLSRPDGLLLSIGVLVALSISSQRMSSFIVFGAVPYVILMATSLAVNLRQFGHLAPTTARLKFGAAPSLGYTVRYVLENAILSYSALTLFAGLVVFYVVFRRTMPGLKYLSIVVSCVLTAVIAAYNSDVFGGARMWWSSACVLAAMIAVSAPAVLVFGRNPTAPWISISQAYRDNPPSVPAPHGLSIARTVSIGLTILFVAGLMSSLVARRAKGAVISPNLIYGSPTAQQYVIARWIDANLRPGDGSIGFFFLGVAYDLPRFEIADFLGKADESIAASKVKQGPPGHNKWDIDKTLAKWKPQAIVPAGPSDPALAETRENARRHAPDLLLNDTISKDFTYCYVPDSTAGVHDRWGFF